MPDLAQLGQNIIIIAFPLASICLVSSILILREPLSESWPQKLVFIAAFSLAGLGTLYWIINYHIYLWPAVLLAVVIVLLARGLLYNSLIHSLVFSLVMVIIFSLCVIIADLAGAWLMPATYESTLSSPLVIITTRWPVGIAVLGGAWWFNRSGLARDYLPVSPLPGLKELAGLIILYILQISFVTGFMMKVFIGMDTDSSTLNYTHIVLGYFLFMITSVAILIIYNRQARRIAIEDAQASLARQIEKLVHDTKSHRHDFSNHLQLIEALFQNGQYEELKQFIRRLQADTIQFCTTLTIPDPFISAVVNTHLGNARKDDVRFEVSIDFPAGDFSPACSGLHQAQFLDRLLGLAVNSLVTLPAGERWIALDIQTAHRRCIFSVSNPVPPAANGADALEIAGFSELVNSARDYGGRLERVAEPGLVSRMVLVFE